MSASTIQKMQGGSGWEVWAHALQDRRPLSPNLNRDNFPKLPQLRSAFSLRGRAPFPADSRSWSRTFQNEKGEVMGDEIGHLCQK